MNNPSWWKLVLIQIIGVFIIFLIPYLGIDRLIIQTFGSHTGRESVISMMMIILPVFIGWDRKIKGWWVTLLFVSILLFFEIIQIIPLYYDKFCR